MSFVLTGLHVCKQLDILLWLCECIYILDIQCMEPASALQGSTRCYLVRCRGNVKNISCLLAK